MGLLYVFLSLLLFIFFMNNCGCNRVEGFNTGWCEWDGKPYSCLDKLTRCATIERKSTNCGDLSDE